MVAGTAEGFGPSNASEAICSRAAPEGPQDFEDAATAQYTSSCVPASTSIMAGWPSCSTNRKITLKS